MSTHRDAPTTGPVDPPPGHACAPGTNSVAVASFTLGLLWPLLYSNVLVLGMVSLAALVLGCVAALQLRGGHGPGSRRAYVGILLGTLGLVSFLSAASRLVAASPPT